MRTSVLSNLSGNYLIALYQEDRAGQVAALDAITHRLYKDQRASKKESRAGMRRLVRTALHNERFTFRFHKKRDRYTFVRKDMAWTIEHDAPRQTK